MGNAVLQEPVPMSIHARLLESILFLENDTVTLERLQKMTELDASIIEESLQEIEHHYNQGMHGMRLVVEHESVRLVPSEDLHDHLRLAYGRKVDRRLSKAALETLSIIAYAQPITRREIENIRGVSSDTIIRLLKEREYVKVVGYKEVPGKPGLYGTTRKFLYEFNLPSISALPQLSELDKARFTRDEETPDED